MKPSSSVARVATGTMLAMATSFVVVCATAFPSRAAPPVASKPDAQAVEVTPEMIGAGIVSSGAALPAIPPVTGSREKPVSSWGKPLPTQS